MIKSSRTFDGYADNGSGDFYAFDSLSKKKSFFDIKISDIDDKNAIPIRINKKSLKMYIVKARIIRNNKFCNDLFTLIV